MGLTRPLTKDEHALLRQSVIPALWPLVDVIRTVTPSCWECEDFATHEDAADYGMCRKHGRQVPIDKRREVYECFTVRADTPF